MTRPESGRPRRQMGTFGWRVVVTNGNDMESIVTELETAKTHIGSEIPTVILMKTNMGYGVDYMMEPTHGMVRHPIRSNSTRPCPT